MTTSENGNSDGLRNYEKAKGMPLKIIVVYQRDFLSRTDMRSRQVFL
jgi:hypothetical protein